MRLKFFAWLALLPPLCALPARAQQPAGAVTNLWMFKLPDGGAVSSPALAPDGTVYQATFHGWLLALTPDGKLKWKFKAGREIESSPAVAADGTIYFGSRDWKFYALSANGKLKWTFPTGAWVDSSPAIAADGTVYFGSWDKNFYALNPDGSLKWKFATSNIVDSSPAIAADGTIYFGSHDKNFYALGPDGKLKWKYATGGEIVASPAIAANGTVYFSSTDGNLYALRPDGVAKWHLHTGGWTGSSPALDADGNLYLAVALTEHKIYASVSPDGKFRWVNSGEFPIGNSPAVTASEQVCFSIPWVRIGAFDCQGHSPPVWLFPLKGNLSSSPNVDARGVIYACSESALYALQSRTNAAPPAKSSWPMWRADARHTGRVQPVN